MKKFLFGGLAVLVVLLVIGLLVGPPKEDERGSQGERGAKPSSTQQDAVPDESRIKAYCAQVGGDSYVLREACTQEERSAKARLASRSIDPSIDRYCAQVGASSYVLHEACIDEELKAKSRLGM